MDFALRIGNLLSQDLTGASLRPMARPSEHKQQKSDNPARCSLAPFHFERLKYIR
jgi:hypothetical protein